MLWGNSENNSVFFFALSFAIVTKLDYKQPCVEAFFFLIVFNANCMYFIAWGSPKPCSMVFKNLDPSHSTSIT